MLYIESLSKPHQTLWWLKQRLWSETDQAVILLSPYHKLCGTEQVAFLSVTQCSPLLMYLWYLSTALGYYEGPEWVFAKPLPGL